MALVCVLTMLAAAAVSFAARAPAHRAQSPEYRDLPCPNEMEIMPCTCHATELLNMILDCSLISTNEDLERAFNATFPFKDFQQLIIKHDPADSSNALTEIKSDTFHTLTFQMVTITGTQLQTIQENVFSYSHNTLTQLNLQNNKISSFPFESVSGYSKLEILLLDKNKLPKLEKFDSNSLKTLSVGYNVGIDFTADVLERIPNLENLNMEGIGLQEIPIHMFRNMTKIYFISFNDNDLTQLDEFTIDPINNSLGRILLANNRIYELTYNSINGLVSSAFIDMSNNRITEMTRSIWEPIMDQLIPNGILDLTGNPLTCGCDMSWMFLGSGVYPSILTDYTTCYDGTTQVIYLDVNVFNKHCT